MPKITFFHDTETPMIPADSGASRARHPGSDEEPQLVEVELKPNTAVDVHAHKQPEIMYVIRGEMSFGAQVLRTGDSVSISGLTLYKFKSGPDGVRYVNFRPRKDQTFFAPDQLAKYQQLDPAAQADMERRNAEEFMTSLKSTDASNSLVTVD